MEGEGGGRKEKVKEGESSHCYEMVYGEGFKLKLTIWRRAYCDLHY